MERMVEPPHQHANRLQADCQTEIKATAVPYRGLTADVWEKCIEHSSSQKFKEKMVEEREEQTQQASSSGVAVNEHDVVLKVLGERMGHRRAVGWVLKGTSCYHSSTSTLLGPTQFLVNLLRQPMH
ncbi:hypothetical protein Fot_23581 [Forsythia ovata]|uniref:Uncharacterized protein n=1 Tax=Forsythia ovata TaxID=205694 RepID=A0ABD1V108_9LAMI